MGDLISAAAMSLEWRSGDFDMAFLLFCGGGVCFGEVSLRVSRGSIRDSFSRALLYLYLFGLWVWGFQGLVLFIWLRSRRVRVSSGTDWPYALYNSSWGIFLSFFNPLLVFPIFGGVYGGVCLVSPISGGVVFSFRRKLITIFACSGRASF